MLCNSCDCVYVNGIKCHETGCPDAYKDEQRECKWCGSTFTPEERDQHFCSDDCQAAYYGRVAE